MEKKVLEIKSLPQDFSQTNEHFIKAQEFWNEIFGRAIKSKRNWRSMAFILALVLLAAIAGLTWQGSQSKVIPYVVVLDKSGQELHTGIVEKSSTLDIKITKKEIGSFIRNNRLASVDRQLMLQNIDWVYAHMLPNTPAFKKVNAYFKENNPFELIEKETRIVDQITSVLPVTKNTWAIEWQETTRNATSAEILEVGKYKAIITVSKKDPETARQWKFNPFGVWIVDIEWEKKL